MSGGSRHSRPAERGASGAEYIGIVVAAAVVVGILLTVIVSQTDIAGRTAAAVCRILDRDDCDEVGEQVETALERALAGDYVAMGDSFASGEGAGDYREGTDYDMRDDWDWNNWGSDDHNRCRRSTSAYAERIFGSNPFGGSFTPVYCSGALMGAELEGSDGDERGSIYDPNPDHTGENPQIEALSEDTSLVTMSIGGNDLGFGDVLRDCMINGQRGIPGFRCQGKWGDTLAQRIDELRPQLVALYGDIKEAAPNARVIIMGYPRLFHEPPSEPLNNLLFAEDQIWMNSQADALNAMLREAAREAGVEFIDPTSAFSNNGVGSDNPWINDMDWGGPGISLYDPGSFHPNAAGHEAMADLLQEQLRNPRYP